MSPSRAPNPNTLLARTCRCWPMARAASSRIWMCGGSSKRQAASTSENLSRQHRDARRLAALVCCNPLGERALLVAVLDHQLRDVLGGGAHFSDVSTLRSA